MLDTISAHRLGTFCSMPDTFTAMAANRTDSERFEALFAEHRGAILAFALRRAESAEEAADVVAETFTVAWRKLDDVPAGDKTLPWLYATARNTLANARRAGQRRDALTARAGNELAIVLDAAMVESLAVGPAQELSEHARDSLMSLRGDEREALLLVAWEGLKPREVARVLGISPVTARTRIHRARRNFSAALGGNRPLTPISTTLSQEES